MSRDAPARRWPLLPVAVAVLILIGLGLGLVRQMQQQPAPDPMIGQTIPALPTTILDRTDLAAPPPGLQSYRVINLFASWCTPCRAEHPHLQELGKSLAITGVAYKDPPADTNRFLDDLGNPYVATVSDPDGRFGITIGMTGVPETYVVDRQGRIIAHIKGPLTADTARSLALTFGAASPPVPPGSP